jgi:hypothetical protein
VEIRTGVEWEKNSNGTLTTINTESNTEKYSGSSTNTPSLTIFYAELSSLTASSRVHSFCNIQSRARTYAILVIGLYELLGNPTT